MIEIQHRSVRALYYEIFFKISLRLPCSTVIHEGINEHIEKHNNPIINRKEKRLSNYFQAKLGIKTHSLNQT